MRTGRPPRPVEERFWNRVALAAPDECWEWTGGRDRGGYGQFKTSDEYRAHRASYILHIGPIPDGLSVLHTCDNPPCVNPAHLFLGTDADNMADRDAKGRNSRGETHPSAKLSVAQVSEIRSLCDEGWQQIDVAPAYGLTQGTVGKIARRKIWRSVPEAA